MFPLSLEWALIVGIPTFIVVFIATLRFLGVEIMPKSNPPRRRR